MVLKIPMIIRIRLIKYSSSNDNFDSLSYSNVISCAYTMIKVVQEGINPILNQNDYPDLKVRIGIEFGEIAVVMYGVDMDEYNNMILKRPHLDLIGYTISIAVKMTSLAKPDHIVIGEELFSMLHGKLKDTFKQLSITPDLMELFDRDYRKNI